MPTIIEKVVLRVEVLDFNSSFMLFIQNFLTCNVSSISLFLLFKTKRLTRLSHVEK